VTHSGLGLVNLRDFVDHARRQPDPVLFASAGVGTQAHLAGELFRQLANIDIRMIQYRGGADAALAVLKGEAKLTSVPISIVLPHIEAGKMKPLAVASSRRFAGAPDIPTSAEAGVPGFESEQWVGIVAPTGVSDWIADKLNRDIVEALRSPELEPILRAQGAEIAPSAPNEFATFIASETARLKKLIDAVGVRIE
jgi:tripartite-type tricarboxylate transporter receptor subunit TctC